MAIEKNRLGVDYLEVMIRFMGLIENPCVSKHRILVNFISKEIARQMTREEEVSMLHSLLNYNQSEPLSEERTKCMKYLFDFEFLNHTNNDKSGV